MKSKALYILLSICLISCQSDFKEISEKEKYNLFLENLIKGGLSTGPEYLSLFIVNTDTSSYAYNDTTQICVHARLIAYYLTSIDSTIIINGYWDEKKLTKLTQNRTLSVNSTTYRQLCNYSVDDTLQIEAIDLLFEKYGIKNLLIDYKENPSRELSDSLDQLLSPFYTAKFRTMVQHYLFIHGIKTVHDCEGRGPLIVGTYK